MLLLTIHAEIDAKFESQEITETLETPFVQRFWEREKRSFPLILFPSKQSRVELEQREKEDEHADSRFGNIGCSVSWETCHDYGYALFVFSLFPKISGLWDDSFPIIYASVYLWKNISMAFDYFCRHH